jgi:hypothetical protein
MTADGLRKLLVMLRCQMDATRTSTGSERLDNKHVLHRHCHDQKPTGLMLAGTPDKDHMTEEPDKAKVLCPVLQGDGRR